MPLDLRDRYTFATAPVGKFGIPTLQAYVIKCYAMCYAMCYTHLRPTLE